ncbi:MAG: V-type ATP synthase subunit E, partial [Oscillospiraceae bacterium]|nr:V-type ATP synthase subunit E [Oscillospiraceae bacterium]
LEAKKRLLLAREKIISRVMSEAENKLKEFTENDEYEAWLTAKTEKALFEVGKGAKTVYISPNDLRFKEKIEQLSDGARLTVEAAQERDFLGGVKVYNTDRKMAVDYSFGEMLSEQKSIFLQNSGLTID